jgi:DNA-binding NarL/FixJ family response regulator
MRTITFTADDRRALAHDRYYHPDPRVQRKMEVLWLKSHGLNHDDIATYADVSRRTVQRTSTSIMRAACHACAAAGGITPTAPWLSTRTRWRSTS